MAFLTVPCLLLLFLTFWLTVSLRRGEVNIYYCAGSSIFGGWLSETNCLQFSRRYEPVKYWIALAFIATLDVLCASITLLLYWMGLTW